MCQTVLEPGQFRLVLHRQPVVPAPVDAEFLVTPVAIPEGWFAEHHVGAHVGVAVGAEGVARDDRGGRVEPQPRLREPREVRVEFLAQHSLGAALGRHPEGVADAARRVEHDPVRVRQFRHEFREFDGGGRVASPRRLGVSAAELFGDVGPGGRLDPLDLVAHRAGEFDSGLTVQVFEHVTEQPGDLPVVAADGDGPPQGVLPTRVGELALGPQPSLDLGQSEPGPRRAAHRFGEVRVATSPVADRRSSDACQSRHLGRAHQVFLVAHRAPFQAVNIPHTRPIVDYVHNM